MKVFTAVILLLTATSANIEQYFEGQYRVIKSTFSDTTEVVYTIKNNRVRIEELSENQQPLITYLIDLNREKLVALNAEKKLYKELNHREFYGFDDEHFEIIKSGNYKMITGVKCYQWRVRNRSYNTEIAYWVTFNNIHV
ncbi:DUF4412 domain-containing protein, partial [Bacteroidota bacterium]